MIPDSYDAAAPWGGSNPPGYSRLSGGAFGLYGSGGLVGPAVYTPLNDGPEELAAVLRVGPTLLAPEDTAFFLPVAIPSGCEDAVDTELIVAQNYFTSDHSLGGVFLLHRWAEGASNSGIRFGFSGTNYLVVDVNQVQQKALGNSTYALRFNLSGMTDGRFHALRLTTRTLGDDVYTTGWVHFNLADRLAVNWTKLFTLYHRNNSSDVEYVQHYSGSPISGVAVGDLNGLTAPCRSGRSGWCFAARIGGAVYHSFALDFLALVGN